jgi:hypothetical protein
MATAPFALTAPSTAPPRPILIDGLYCVAVGAIATFASGPISTFMGLPSSLPLIVIGLATLIYGLALTGWAATRPVPRALLQLAMILNDVWVAASAALLIFNLAPLTEGGRWLVLIVAVDVGLLAIWQWVALRRG